MCSPRLQNPWYVSVFLGPVFDSDLADGSFFDDKITYKQRNGIAGGLAVGYHFSDWFGTEMRVYTSSAGVHTTLPVLGNMKIGETESTVFDISTTWYPFLSLFRISKWQPYLKGGVGVGQQKIDLTFLGIPIHAVEQTIATIPLGVGARYWCKERFAIQVDLTDNIVVWREQTSKTQHHVALSLGLTWAFGGGKKRQVSF